MDPVVVMTLSVVFIISVVGLHSESTSKVYAIRDADKMDSSCEDYEKILWMRLLTSIDKPTLHIGISFPSQY